MTTVWVFDELGKPLHKRDLVMLLASAKLWSIHCPQDTRILFYGGSLGYLLENLGIPKVFNKVISLSTLPKFNVDSSVFWSYPKLRVLSQVREPVTIVDHDFITFCNLREYLDPTKICYSYTEDARQYYPNNLDSLVRQLSYRTRWPDFSANVSFLQLPDPEFTQFYAGTSLQIMEELSNLKAPNAKYLIFAEQMVLKHLIQDQEYQCLLKEIYECRSESFTETKDPNGIFSWKDAFWKKFIHYGPLKKKWNSMELKREMDFLCETSGFDPKIFNRL